jgi:hypothetical protein
VTGDPLTVKLVDVPEAQALDVILRSVAGYMAAPRSTGSGPSRYDRILVMATSSTPAPAAPPRATPQQPNPAFNGTQRFIPPQRQVANEDEVNDEDPTPPNPPVFTFPGAPGQGQPVFPNVNGQPQQMPMIVNPAIGGTQQPIQLNPAPGGYPAVPFGTSTPGVINPPPPQPGQRPPGGRQ